MLGIDRCSTNFSLELNLRAIYSFYRSYLRIKLFQKAWITIAKHSAKCMPQIIPIFTSFVMFISNFLHKELGLPGESYA